MTKERLEKMQHLIKEAKHLQELLHRPARGNELVSDTIKDYRTGYPHSIVITGYGEWNYPEIQERYYQKLRTIQQEIAFLENFLDNVADPETRDILRLYYVNGLTQEQIADELGYARETVTRKIKKFWKSH